MRRWERSTDGRTWEQIDVSERSPLFLEMTRKYKPGEVYDDGYGNLYRYTEDDG